jgi:RNA polymerase sigma-70 factor (ECF subfamily)
MTTETSDEELVRRTRAGSDDAFATLVGRHKGRVLAITSRFARNAHELDDLAQETFVQAWRSLGTFRGDAPFEHWVSRIAVRKCHDLLRRARHERGDISLDAENHLRAVLADPSPASENETREAVEFALRQLKPEERLVLTLLELDDRSVAETASLTGWSEGNVKVRAHRARHALAQLLKDYHE